MAYSEATVFGSMVIDVNEDSLTAKFLDNNAASPKIHDKFVIVKRSSGSTQVTGIEDVNNGVTGEMKVFPSPSNGKVFIQGATKESTATIKLLNTIGQVVFNKEVEVNNGILKEQLELGSQFSNGIYIVSVKMGEKVNTTKILLAK